MADSDQKVRIETEPSDGFLLSEKLMLVVVGILSAALVFVIGRHIYDRWYFMRLRRRERELHRRRPGPTIHNVLYSNNVSHHHIVDRGLGLVVLSSLPVFLYPRGEAHEEEPPQGCTVCLSEFEKDDIIRLLPKCNHSFHVDCIDMWFHSHSTCPLCRSQVERVTKPVPIRGIPGSSSVHGRQSACGEYENVDTPVADGETLSPRPDMFEYHLEDENLIPCSGANQGVRFSRTRLMTLKRILSMNRKPADGVAAVDGGGGSTCVDLECGELTRESNHAHKSNG